MKVRPNPYPAFRPLYELDEGIFVLIGGRGGMKSYEASKWVAVNLISNFKARGTLIRDEAVTIKNSILNDVKKQFKTIDAKTGGNYSKVYTVNDSFIKNEITGQDAVFSLGMRSSNNEQQAKLKSLSEVNFTVTEEAEDIRDEDKLFRLFDSVRDPKAKHLILLNTPDKNHWIIKRFFNLIPSDYPGFFDIEPKKIKGVTQIITSFKDNKHLPQNIVERYQSYGNPESPMYNPEKYCREILGLVSEGVKGRVYKKFKTCTEQEFDSLPYDTFYGLDFGFSNDQAALVAVKVHNNKIWAKEMFYELERGNKWISDFLKENVPEKSWIVADSAEPKSIHELQAYGHYVIGAIKKPGSVKTGIKALDEAEVYITENSHNLIHETQEYQYKTKDGIATDTLTGPDHLLDALRYVYHWVRETTGTSRTY